MKAKIAVLAIIAALWNVWSDLNQADYLRTAFDSTVFGISVTVLVFLYRQSRRELA